MDLFLIVLNGASKGKQEQLTPSSNIVIGRGDSCGFQIADESVSRAHAYVFVDEKGIPWIEDAGSVNGVFVNNQRILKKMQVFVNDLIQVGLIKIRIENGNADSVSKYSTLDLGMGNSNILFRKGKQDPTFSKNFQTIKMHRDLVLLHKISKLMYKYHEIPALLQALIEEITTEMCTERGCIFVHQKSPELEKPLYLFFCRGRGDTSSKEEFVLDKSILDNTVLNGQGTISARDSFIEGNTSHADAELQKLKISSTICVPLQGHQGCLGALYLDSISTNNLFGEDELDLLTAITRQIALAIERLFLEIKLVASVNHYKSIYQSIIEHATDVIYRSDEEGNCLIISPSIEKLLGYKADEFLHNFTIWTKCVHKDDFESFYEQRNKVFEDKHCILKYRMVRMDKKVIWVEEILYLVIEENHTFTQGILRDVTERVLLQEQLQRAQRMEAMGLLAGGVAHDLNNILSGLLGYPDLLLMKLPPDSPLCKYLHGIKESAERASDVVNDLLALARRENYSMDAISVNRIVNEYVNSLDFQAIKRRHAGVDIKLELGEDSIYIKGSISHLIKSFMNLLINALQAMPKGGNVFIRSYKVNIDDSFLEFSDIEHGEYGVIEIEDSGEGIAEKDLAKIFEPFYSKKIHKRGTGLGLAIVYGVIQDHKGHIDVKSVEKEGTVFSIYLPITIPDIKRIPTSALDLTGVESVLVIDDVPEQRELAKEFLEPLGYTVSCVDSGEAAIVFLQKNYVDILILDMILEDGIDGLETYQQIKKIHPNQKAIIASGFANNERVQETQALGAGAYLGKPYNRQQLSIAIRKELNRKKQKRIF